jgi:hypothetical protein
MLFAGVCERSARARRDDDSTDAERAAAAERLDARGGRRPPAR